MIELNKNTPDSTNTFTSANSYVGQWIRNKKTGISWQISPINTMMIEEHKTLIINNSGEYAYINDDDDFEDINFVSLNKVFKRGDYLIAIDSDLMIICDFVSEEGIVYAKVTYRGNRGITVCQNSFSTKMVHNLRLTTTEEHELFDKHLAQMNQKYNKDSHCTECILKQGNLVIAWMNPAKEAIIGYIHSISNTVKETEYYSESEHTASYHIGDNIYYNAIKYESLEQYKEFIKEQSLLCE